MTIAGVVLGVASVAVAILAPDSVALLAGAVGAGLGAAGVVVPTAAAMGDCNPDPGFACAADVVAGVVGGAALPLSAFAILVVDPHALQVLGAVRAIINGLGVAAAGTGAALSVPAIVESSSHC